MPGTGVQALSVPKDVMNDVWAWKSLSTVSQDEQLSVADINRDGYEDLVLGTIWLDQAADWTQRSISSSIKKPDRNRLVDMNKDGWVDIVVGEEAVDKLGRVVWYKNPGNLSGWQEGNWQAHVVSELFGPMSMGLADIDHDGDTDIVIGEHRLKAPNLARLVLLENRDGLGLDWNASLIHQGDEHHNGLQISDLDKDGDDDIVSIGWGHSQVMVYENRSGEIAR